MEYLFKKWARPEVVSRIQKKLMVASVHWFTLKLLSVVFFRAAVHTKSVVFYMDIETSLVPPDWFHFVLLFRGPDNGIIVYINGSVVNLPAVANIGNTFTETEGNVVLGREYADRDTNYGHVAVDELYF